MTECSKFFEEHITRDNQSAVYLFSQPDCQGEVTSIHHAGEVPTTAFQSCVIPENFKVRLTKEDQQQTLLLDFNPVVWGTTVDDVDLVIDRWSTLHGHKIHSSLADVRLIDIQWLGDRNRLLASSCVGLQEPPIPDYEPEKHGQLNPTCDHFMDVYCQASDAYSRELCQHRKTSVTISVSIPTTTNQSSTWLWVVVALVLFACLLILACWSEKHTSKSDYPFQTTQSFETPNHSRAFHQK